MNIDYLYSKFPKGTFGKLFIIYWLVGVVILFFTKQGDVVLFINSISSPDFDIPIKLIDFLGHGTFAFFLAILVLIYRVNYGILFFSSLAFVSLFANLLKRMVFLQHYRPFWFLYYDDFDRFISIAPINYLRSFPSGHSMTAFALAAVLSFLVKNGYLQCLFFVLALIVSFARIYLCQHFFVDTLWGAMLGVFAAMLGKLLVDKLVERNQNGLLQLSLFKYFKLYKKRTI